MKDKTKNQPKELAKSKKKNLVMCLGYQKETTQSRCSTGIQDKKITVKINQFEVS